MTSTPAGGSRVRVVLADDHPVVLAGVKALLQVAPEIDLVGETGDGEPEEFEPADYVWGHMRGVPAHAALIAMSWGADLRTAYLTYRSMEQLLKGNLTRAFDAEPPEPFEEIGFGFLEEEFGAKLGPNDLAAWDHEFEHQWDEPEEEAA